MKEAEKDNPFGFTNEQWADVRQKAKIDMMIHKANAKASQEIIVQKKLNLASHNCLPSI